MQAFKYVLRFVIFTVCLVLLITQYKAVGRAGLGLMLIAVAGLLGLLYEYNRPYFPEKRK